MTENDPTFLEWEVKPVFTVYYPSSMTGAEDQSSVKIFGLERASGEIIRNWEVINSVEQHRQGYKKMPSDITITLAVKEQGKAFEILRRLGKSGTMFDVECSLVTDEETNHQGGEHDYTSYEWMQGFEQWKGCIINRESQTIEIGDIPIREFECMALRHNIQSITAGPDASEITGSGEEGDGVPPTLDDLLGS